jgi:hypothetical protein
MTKARKPTICTRPWTTARTWTTSEPIAARL